MHDLDRQQLEQQERMGESGGATGTLSGELTEAQELALASEVLEISNEEELEEFLGDLWNATKAAASSAYNSDVVRAAIPGLKAVGAAVLPKAAGWLADRYAPGTGGIASAGVQAAVDQWLKEELEGLSGEDREFEVARRYVRFANDVLQRAAQVPDRVVAPPVAAQVVLRDATREHVPGLVPFLVQLDNGGTVPGGRGVEAAASGRWTRQGSSIVIDLQ
jgi:hypothetical protein